jgi:hypothetical protein
MTSTAITDAMREKALATAFEIIRFAQTAARHYPDGYDLSLAMLRTADPLAYKEMLDAVILLEAQNLAKRQPQGLCTIYATTTR